jgi:hypothetical protein
MGLREQFKKLISKQPEPTSRREAIFPQEAWRRAVIRSGNLDWQGRPIDRNPGRPIPGRPEQAGYFQRVTDFLERSGMRIERRNQHPQMIPDRLFDQEAGIAAQAHERRFDGRNRDQDSMDAFLRDGAVAPPKRES